MLCGSLTPGTGGEGMEINYIKLGDRIRFYRTRAAISQEKLSELIGLSSFQQISNIETGRTSTTLETIVNIAHALNVSVDQLLIDSLPENAQNKNDLNSLLLDCTPEEVSILVENFTDLKKVLSKYQIKE
jgi:transcriptional regulator with XRE-family HTH domain